MLINSRMDFTNLMSTKNIKHQMLDISVFNFLKCQKTSKIPVGSQDSVTFQRKGEELNTILLSNPQVKEKVLREIFLMY